MIRSKHMGRNLELLPLDALEDDFPRSLINGHIHWRDLDSNEVQWRHEDDPWTLPQDYWYLGSDDGISFLRRGDLRLLDVHSITAKAVHKVLRPLENSSQINLYWNVRTNEVNVSLPRLKLDFLLLQNPLQLRAKQWPGMIMDANQTLGTFTGLKNKILLRSPNNEHRMCIIPDGEVTISKTEHHVKVTIFNASDYVPYHVYTIDQRLGRLIDGGSLSSKLFKCYLHAISSHCLPDSLTGRTGTEQAISDLSGASIVSFSELTAPEARILSLIADITPARQFLARKKGGFQCVSWNSELPSLSQHSRYVNLVDNIFDQILAIQRGTDTPGEIDKPERIINQHLLRRAEIRDFCLLHGWLWC